MKIFTNILVSCIVMFLVFMSGVYFGDKHGKYNEKTVKNQADGLLAYEHYYEAAEVLLKNKVDTTTVEGKDLDCAKQQLCDFLSNNILEWPEVCDQRDILSDAIRMYHDHHPEFRGNKDHDIYEFVADRGLDPNLLQNWAYSY